MWQHLPKNTKKIGLFNDYLSPSKKEFCDKMEHFEKILPPFDKLFTQNKLKFININKF
jgi:hypothetical protein